jgi:hypothetical protein
MFAPTPPLGNFTSPSGFDVQHELNRPSVDRSILAAADALALDNLALVARIDMLMADNAELRRRLGIAEAAQEELAARLKRETCCGLGRC